MCEYDIGTMPVLYERSSQCCRDHFIPVVEVDMIVAKADLHRLS